MCVMTTGTQWNARIGYEDAFQQDMAFHQRYAELTGKPHRTTHLKDLVLD
jgi:putative heme iron utilization protein